MAKLTRPERAPSWSRVLRYEQLSIAQQRIREEKNALAAELHGREAGLPSGRRSRASGPPLPAARAGAARPRRRRRARAAQEADGGRRRAGRNGWRRRSGSIRWTATAEAEQAVTVAKQEASAWTARWRRP